MFGNALPAALKDMSSRKGGGIMKSMNVKIPIDIAQRMSDEGRLNSQFLSTFITNYLTFEFDDEPLSHLVVNYTFKLDEDVHKKAKLQSIEKGIPMNEMIGRLLRRYY